MAESEPEAGGLGAGLRAALLGVIAVVLVGLALRATYVVAMPLTFAFFIAVLTQPLKRRLDGVLPRGTRWLSLPLVMLLVLVILALGVGAIWLSVETIAGRAPDYVEDLEERWETLVAWARVQTLPIEEGMLAVEDIGERVIEALTFGVVTILSALAYVTLIFFLVLLMLVEANAWHGKLANAARRHAPTALHVVDIVARKVRQYMLVRMGVSAITGVAVGLWTWALGVDFAVIWGLLAFLLNFIPYAGSIAAVIPPALMGFLQLGWAGGLMVLAGLTAIQQVIGNLVDPRLQGRALQLSPLVVLAALLLWAWMWGVAGALLAVPITVVVVVVCEHVPALRPIAVLLGRVPEEQPA